MKINCKIAEDLLPLYLEELCSEESKTALEAHLNECPDCKKKWERMKNQEILPAMRQEKRTVSLADCAKRIRRRRLRMGIGAALACILTAFALFLCFLTVEDMQRIANPIVHEVEAGVVNLTDGVLETTAGAIENCVLFTNYKQIQVQVEAEEHFEGEILLWNLSDVAEPCVIGYGRVDADNSCTFAHLSSALRYRITCDGAEDMKLIVSEGREIHFWSSLKNVCRALAFVLLSE